MSLPVRILLLVIIIPSVYYFTFWVPFSFLEIAEQQWIRNIVALIVAIGCGWFIWSKTNNRSSKGFLSSI